jgi:tight adherence protein C
MIGSAIFGASTAGLLCALAWRFVRDRLAAKVQGDAYQPRAGLLPMLAHRLDGLNRPLLRPAYESKLRRWLGQAGEPRSLTPSEMLTLQEIGGAVGLLVGIVGCRFAGIHLAWSAVASLVGAAYPLLWLKDQVKKRLLKIARALPYHLDLLTLAVEAGLDFTGALSKVVDRGRPGPLRDELQLVLKQLRLGRTREQALAEMMLRIGLPQLSQFVRALIQAEKMGTGLGSTLRIQAGQMRFDRSQRAEKLANQAPVKMLLPLVACIFPTVFMILFGPIVFALMFGD